MKAVPVCGRAEQVRIGQGLRLLSLCRTNGLWTAKKRAGAKFIHRKYKKLCPCCGIVGEGETVEHILMSCGKWEKERRQHLEGVFKEIEDMGPADEEERVTMLLGGESSGKRLESWLPSSTTLEAINCGAFQVARFLWCIRGDRAEILNQIPSRDLDLD